MFQRLQPFSPFYCRLLAGQRRNQLLSCLDVSWSIYSRVSCEWKRTCSIGSSSGNSRNTVNCLTPRKQWLGSIKSIIATPGYGRICPWWNAISSPYSHRNGMSRNGTLPIAYINYRNCGRGGVVLKIGLPCRSGNIIAVAILPNLIMTAGFVKWNQSLLDWQHYQVNLCNDISGRVYLEFGWFWTLDIIQRDNLMVFWGLKEYHSDVDPIQWGQIECG